jgi:hypothetical protein
VAGRLRGEVGVGNDAGAGGGDVQILGRVGEVDLAADVVDLRAEQCLTGSWPALSRGAHWSYDR